MSDITTCDSCKRVITTTLYRLDITQEWRPTPDPYAQHMDSPYRRRILCRVCVTYLSRLIELPVYREPQDSEGREA